MYNHDNIKRNILSGFLIAIGLLLLVIMAVKMLLNDPPHSGILLVLGCILLICGVMVHSKNQTNHENKH